MSVSIHALVDDATSGSCSTGSSVETRNKLEVNIDQTVQTGDL